ncbi:hypothetical protein MKW92_005713 [Papaver armeniacum]|nr:hypothetical protein MKW92_005713 [Papaver armeniacum]
MKDPANRLSSWLEGNKYRNCCNWHGIECSSDSSPHVISINLRNTVLETYINEYFKDDFNIRGPTPDTSLHGKFSSSFVDITHLEYLDLAFNNFHESPIPFQFSELTKLMHLDLSHLNFSASVSTPFNAFANLSSLQYVDLSCGPVPYSFDTYSCLESSSLKWLRGLVNLKVLRLSHINLYEVSFSERNFAESISYLSNLRDLDLSYCNISSTVFPIHEFTNLSRLSSLKMVANWGLTSEIPVEMANLTSLSILDLSYCGLQGSVPYLPQLKEFNVGFNYNLHPNLTNMFRLQWPKLQRLSMTATNIGGTIPSSISNAPVLVSLYANACSIQGFLPPSIYSLSHLQSLDLSENSITGYIPSSISNLKSLNILDLSVNNFQGSIQKSICQILPLEKLYLHRNNITGTIPSCITKLKNLTHFDVHGNSIEGNVSLISLINELNLSWLDLGSNRITVVIDQNFHAYSKLKLGYLSLRSCNLNGVFPSLICELSHLFS